MCCAREKRGIVITLLTKLGIIGRYDCLRSDNSSLVCSMNKSLLVIFDMNAVHLLPKFLPVSPQKPERYYRSKIVGKWAIFIDAVVLEPLRRQHVTIWKGTRMQRIA